jgi:hypothetical protein
MNLHANAALSLNKRRDLCQRVVVEGWTLTKAAAAAEVSVRCARKWVGRTSTSHARSTRLERGDFSLAGGRGKQGGGG